MESLDKGSFMPGSRKRVPRTGADVLLLSFVAAPPGPAEEPKGRAWERHTVDSSISGADGVRLGDANGDGLPDIATGWEEGGVVRAYLHPGYAGVRKAWPSVQVGL